MMMVRIKAAGSFLSVAWLAGTMAAQAADPMSCSNSHFLALVVPEGSSVDVLRIPTPATHIASNKAPEISAAELEEVHHRVLGHPAHAYKQALPSLDVFASHGAGAVFVALLDGVETTTSYVQGLQAARGLYQARVGGLKDLHAVAKRYAGNATSSSASSSSSSSSFVACIACDPATRDLPVCQQQQQQQEVVAIDPLSQKIDLSFIEKEMEAVASATEIGNTFNVHGAADRRFLSELQALLKLVTLLPSTPSPPSSSPDFILFAADGLRTLQLTYGPSSPPSSLAKRMMDVAMAKTNQVLGVKYGEKGGVISEVLLRQTGAVTEPIAPRRRLQDGDSDSTPLTEEDIFNVNILTWTTVGLILVLLLSLCLLYGADSGPRDSLLYAKFLADTSGGKMD
ncbi:Hypothetical protein NocV09_09000120 [Nannochloropsis oceanica]